MVFAGLQLAFNLWQKTKNFKILLSNEHGRVNITVGTNELFANQNLNSKFFACGDKKVEREEEKEDIENNFSEKIGGNWSQQPGTDTEQEKADDWTRRGRLTGGS